MAYTSASLDSFICYYLYLGFRTLYLYLDDPNDAPDESGNGPADFRGQLRRKQALAARCHACISGELGWVPMLEPLSRARLAWERRFSREAASTAP